MRRSLLLQVVVYCPHFQRPVVARHNQATGRLVSCDENLSCRIRVAGLLPESSPVPLGCPVYPSLASGQQRLERGDR